MRRIRKWAPLSALLAGLVIAITPAQSEPPREELMRAVRNGQIMPLHEVKRRVERQFGAPVIGQSLPRRVGENKWVYDLRILEAGGHVVDLEVDARTGRVLKRRGGS